MNTVIMRSVRKGRLNALLSLLLVTVMVLGALPTVALASGTTDITAYVTLSRNSAFVTDKNGEAVVQRAVALTGKSTYTIDDVLRALHDVAYDGGAEAGYGSDAGDYGTSLSKLWGDNSFNFGYYVNNAMAMSLDETVADGSYVDAFIYQYGYPNTEAYAHFDKQTLTADVGESVELTLKYISGWGGAPDYAPIFSVLPGASITVNGTEPSTPVSTSADGKATLSFDAAGTYVISAIGPEGTNITAPACVVTVVAPISVSDIAITGVTYDFNSDTYAYGLPDQLYNKGSLKFKVNAAGAKSITACVNGAVPVALTSAKEKSLNLKAGENVISITVNPVDGSHALPKTYTYSVKRAVALKALSVTLDGGGNVNLSPTFSADTYSYSSTVVVGTRLSIASQADGDSANTDITINGEDPAASYVAGLGPNVYNITAKSTDEKQTAAYTLTITGVDSVSTDITAPKHTLLTVTDPSGNVLPNGQGVLSGDMATYSFSGLISGGSYSWHAGQYGFNACTGSFTASSNETDDVTIELTAASAPESLLTAQWGSFRASESNMAIVDVETPRSAAEAKELWVASAKDGWNPVTYLIVNNNIVAVSGTKLCLINMDTGAIAKTVTMAASRGYGYMPPVYGGGMIYVPLEGGKIQAFDAETLASKWMYTDAIGGQALSAIAYDDGYIYTGFSSNSSAKSNNWVCIQVADEDSSSADEAKYATWTYTHLGGFYWSGAYITGDWLVVGADNATLSVLDKRTGRLADSETVDGDIRCSIAAYEGGICFVTKGGSLYTASISSSGEVTSLTKKAAIGGESTSTPVVVNGAAYVGVKNKSIARVDLATGAVTTATTLAYSQSSLLATRAYQGKTYLYFACNQKPGSLYVLQVNEATGDMSVSELYRPEAANQNFGIASIMCSDDGTLYYSNDSGNVFAIGKKAPTGAPVSFYTVPGDASVTVTAQTAIAGGSYDLAAGTYDYTVAKAGYVTKTGSLTVSAEDAANHASKSVTVSLVTAGAPEAKNISVTVKVKTHDAGDCGNAYTYKSNASAFTDIASEPLVIASGSTVFDALDAALSAADVSYVESSYGYISSIDGIAEMDHGENSGWMFMVNGVNATVGCRDYILRSNATVIWYYTDDYTKEQGSEKWSSGGSASTIPGDSVIQPIASVKGNVASADVTDKAVADSIKAATNSKNGNIIIAPKNVGDAADLYVTLSKAAGESIVSDTDADLVIQAPGGSVTIPNNALDSILSHAGDSIEFIITKKTPADVKDDSVDAEDSIIVDVSIISGNKAITTFGGKELTIGIPVDNTYIEGKSYRVIIISADGSYEIVYGKCVKTDGKLTVQVVTTHLSTFIVTHEADTSFADVSGHWALGAVQYARDNNLMNGVGGNLFDPEGTLNRAMLVTILYRLEGEPSTAAANPFKDVPAEQWYTDAIVWAAENKIADGYGSGMFGPVNDITRQQMAKMLLSYSLYKKYDTGKSNDLSGYADSNHISTWANDALKWANAEGLINGRTATTIVPEGNATRAEAATILMRYILNVAE